MDDDLYREQVEEGRRREQMSEAETKDLCREWTPSWGGQSCARNTGHEGPHAARLDHDPLDETPGGGTVVWDRGMGTPRHPASQKFHDLLTEIGALHDRKQRDYGNSTDPFANVRSSQDFGVAPWVGSLVRLNDKVTRLKAFATKGELANESAEDSMLDIAVYALIALLLYREEAGE